MENYINNFNNFTKKIVYNFELNAGGIGDCIKFFMHVLNLCMKNNIRLYYQVNNIPIEKYLKLKYPQMYIEKKDIINKNIINNEKIISNINNNDYNIVTSVIFYKTFNYNNIQINIQDVFDFSEEIKLNSHKLVPNNITNYTSVHLRLGDKHLETDKSFVPCLEDERCFNENALYNFIEQNSNINIIFFCDNNNYKLKIKNKYSSIFITNSEIGHTSLLNTTEKQTLDALTEFYLITNSDKIVCASYSGFSYIASKFKNIPLINL
jgi:hypothetical protein